MPLLVRFLISRPWAIGHAWPSQNETRERGEVFWPGGATDPCVPCVPCISTVREIERKEKLKAVESKGAYGTLGFNNLTRTDDNKGRIDL